jgi:hypothetical protein
MRQIPMFEGRPYVARLNRGYRHMMVDGNVSLGKALARNGQLPPQRNF